MLKLFMDTNLYSIKALNISGSFEIRLKDKSHSVFKAHFPNNPILPGFIFLHICENALNIAMVEVVKAKFISFAKPCDILMLNALQKEDKIYAEFTCKDKKICSLIFKGEKVEQK
jgi:3-hydroxyacyl-[acyl-carrier-protein] dehydratase